MKTFIQWCEQTGKDDVATDISQITQQAIKAGTDPKKDLQKALLQKSVDAQTTGDSKKAAKVAGAVKQINAETPNMKKK